MVISIASFVFPAPFFFSRLSVPLVTRLGCGFVSRVSCEEDHRHGSFSDDLLYTRRGFPIVRLRCILLAGLSNTRLLLARNIRITARLINISFELYRAIHLHFPLPVRHKAFVTIVRGMPDNNFLDMVSYAYRDSRFLCFFRGTRPSVLAKNWHGEPSARLPINK